MWELPDHACGVLRGILDIAGRDSWSFPPFNTRDPEGEDVRSAGVGQFTAVYWINRPAGRLYVVDIVWIGQRADTTTSRPRHVSGTVGALGSRNAFAGRRIVCLHG